jgi:tetratricopeptide (TPR) repeat protein
MMKYEKQIGFAQGIVTAVLGGLVLSMGTRLLMTAAGQTIYASVTLWVALVVGLLLGTGLAWVARRKMGWNAFLLVILCLLMAVYLILLLTLERWFKNGWAHFLLSAHRSLGAYFLHLGKTAVFTVTIPFVLLLIMFLGRGRSFQTSAVNATTQLGLCIVSALSAGMLFDLTDLSPEAFLRLSAVAFAVLSGVNVMRKSKSYSFAWIFSATLPLILVAVLAVSVLPRHWDNPLSASGFFGRLACRDSGFAQGMPLRVTYTRQHTVTQYQDPDYGWVGALDGRPLIFERRFVASRTMTALAPLMLHPEAKKVLLAGEEAGVYLATFVRLGGLEILVSPEAQASTAFVKGNSLFTSEEQSRFKSCDMRSLRGKCDIVFVAPPPCWATGSGQWLSARALQSYRNALTEDGVVAIRIDGRGLSEANFAEIARTFLSVFPGVQLWNTGAADWVLLGGGSELKVPLDLLTSFVERKETFREWVRAGNITLPSALACMVYDTQGLKTWVQERAGQSPDSSWQVPLRIIRGENMVSTACKKGRDSKASWVLSGQMDVDLYVDIWKLINDARDARGLATHSLSEGLQGKRDASLAAVRAAMSVCKQDLLVFQIMDHLDMEARRRIAIGNYKGALLCYESLISFSPSKGLYHHGAGYCLRALGEAENAYLAFARAAGCAPDQEQYRLDLAQAALMAGHYEDADRQYQYLLSKKPTDAHVMFLFAKGLAMKGRPKRDFALAVKMAERACVLTKWKNREYAFGLADIYLEAGRIPEGMGLKRRLKEGALEVKETL